MSLLAIEILTVFGMPPVDVVQLAANLGCRHISASLTPVPWNPCNYPSWSLRDDLELRRELQAVMADRGVSVLQAEGFAVRPGQDVRNLASDMDIMKELGAIRLSTVSMEPDMPRGISQLALLAEMAGEREMGLSLEFAPPHPIGNLATAMDAIARIGLENMQLVIDSMHFFRSGGTISQLAALDPALIGHVQLCDALRVATITDYMEEACFHRIAPGEGELPLEGFVAALPDNPVFGLEVPNIRAAEAGTLESFIGRVVDGARRILSTREK